MMLRLDPGTLRRQKHLDRRIMLLNGPHRTFLSFVFRAVEQPALT